MLTRAPLLALQAKSIYMYYLVHLWSKFVTFMVSQIITFMVKILLHLRLIFITFMVGITFMVEFYYICG